MIETAKRREIVRESEEGLLRLIGVDTGENETKRRTSDR